MLARASYCLIVCESSWSIHCCGLSARNHYQRQMLVIRLGYCRRVIEHGGARGAYERHRSPAGGGDTECHEGGGALVDHYVLAELFACGSRYKQGSVSRAGTAHRSRDSMSHRHVEHYAAHVVGGILAYRLWFTHLLMSDCRISPHGILSGRRLPPSSSCRRAVARPPL